MAEAKTLNRDAVTTGLTVPDDATPEQSFAASLLKKGLDLHDERTRNTEQTGANREMLRGMAKQGIVTDAQAAAINALYPKPERKATTEATGATGETTAPAPAPAPAPDGGSPAAPPAAAKPATAPPAAKK